MFFSSFFISLFNVESQRDGKHKVVHAIADTLLILIPTLGQEPSQLVVDGYVELHRLLEGTLLVELWDRVFVDAENSTNHRIGHTRFLAGDVAPVDLWGLEFEVWC
jgi:hypothetical protein